MFGIIFGAVGTTVNTVMYLELGHHWWSLASAMFCGIITLAMIVSEA